MSLIDRTADHTQLPHVLMHDSASVWHNDIAHSSLAGNARSAVINGKKTTACRKIQQMQNVTIVHDEDGEPQHRSALIGPGNDVESEDRQSADTIETQNFGMINCV